VPSEVATMSGPARGVVTSPADHFTTAFWEAAVPGHPIPVTPPDECCNIPGFPDYQVTPDGRVWSVRRCRFLKPSPSGRRGYLAVGLPGRAMYVHRLVLLAFVGPPDLPNADGCHNDGNVRNNHLSNLRWDTRAGNLADRVRHGTAQCGERNPRAKLTDAQAKEIRRRRAAGELLRVLASEFGVCEPAISRIANGERRGK
jgi:hypothetical protein